MSITIKNITVMVDTKEVISNLSLSIGAGEIHVLAGPNGSGKTSLANALMGNPDYHVTKGSLTMNGKNILKLPPQERSQRGLFLSFQEPPEIHGVMVDSFLRSIAKKQNQKTARETFENAQQQLSQLGLSTHFMNRSLNEGFSGGEKKKLELIQLFALKPKYAILDEIDSGIDVDSLKSIAALLKKKVKEGMGLLVISHTSRLFSILKPDTVHVLKKGRIVASGKASLLKKIEQQGFRALAS